jgi:hypothetical protein
MGYMIQFHHKRAYQLLLLTPDIMSETTRYYSSYYFVIHTELRIGTIKKVDMRAPNKKRLYSSHPEASARKESTNGRQNIEADWVKLCT